MVTRVTILLGSSTTLDKFFPQLSETKELNQNFRMNRSQIVFYLY